MKKRLLTLPTETDAAIVAAAERAGVAVNEWLREHAIRPALGRAGRKLPRVTNGGYKRVQKGRERASQ